ncbi:hypothetical protein Rs2_04778 [Raphanus sativus]|nr:hypothetical protein Rs2_04778 [Raphanus sativus]
MVRVRLVDSPISSESEENVEMIDLPDRMFADGEEPVGVRVLSYHPSSGTRSILKVLSDEEIQIIKASTFGRFIELADKPAFSGRFARYMLSRQLKLVMVEVVPALTEVVQEAGSSSETDSGGEDDDLHEKPGKRLTLSPGHARDVDQKCEVPVKCIIEDKPSDPVDDEVEYYSNEDTDLKVENVRRLHSKKHCFNNSMFKGGITMADVERMGGKGKGKKRGTKARKKAVVPEIDSDSKFATLLYDKMKPEISKFREVTKNLNATVKVASQEFA